MVTAKTTSKGVNLTKLRSDALKESNSLLEEVGNRPISPTANSGMMNAMHTAILVEQNSYIISLLEQILLSENKNG